ncbi:MULTISPECIES: hypothetical protein [Actinokineospora]|uniref:Uncharacterized protein n=2 Tax=Actinokineospora TaxID=39845 RepID=A0A421B545_9PSEU|nr:MULTISPECIES: hypothetical protein [Actinokineospora]RLK59435.1 hypothetical protein CLV68_3922 [Actinokineospora cianjurensis]SES20009.1 hypothetical protein SAMN04487818_108300 [Actinokineospora terrae]
MANTGAMSTPIFDELLREMTEGAAAAEAQQVSTPPADTPAPKPSQGGRRRARTS